MGIFSFFTVSPLALYFHNIEYTWLTSMWMFSIYSFMMIISKWFLDMLKESRYGYHTKKVQNGLKMGMILFIVSEMMFFFAFFWAFFHYSLSPAFAMGCIWPPHGTQKLDILGIPLCNTMLLMSSGFTITACHWFLLNYQHNWAIQWLFYTMLLGIIFLWAQFNEYKYIVSFTWAFDLYGSMFFTLTGFHGLHVTMGTIFLIFNLARYTLTYINSEVLMNMFFYKKMMNFQFWGFVSTHHFGFEAAAWYWHFVDVVWIFLYMAVYWWGGSNK